MPDNQSAADGRLRERGIVDAVLRAQDSQLLGRMAAWRASVFWNAQPAFEVTTAAWRCANGTKANATTPV
jgi:hypothetical protein